MAREAGEMRVVGEVDLLGSEAEQARVARDALVILAAGVAAALVLGAAGPRPSSARGWVAFALALALGYLVSLPLHELAHAAAFKLLGRGRVGRIRFGYESGMLYAGCPGARLPRGRFVAVLLAPLVVLSLAYLAIGALADAPLLAWCLFALHASGCAGDLLMAREIVACPEADLVEDTESGIRLLASQA